MNPAPDGPTPGLDRPNVAAFTDQIHDGPMLFALLEMVECQFRGFMPRQAAGNQDGKQRPVTLTFAALVVWCRHRACPCSAVNQLPNRTPRFFTHLTRRMSAADRH
jgi:hypothetical protein